MRTFVRIKDYAMTRRNLFHLLPLLFVVMLLGSCYEHHQARRLPKDFKFTERILDSLSFFQTHHYTNNYNFVVKADSMVLHRQLPEEEMAGMHTDSFSVYRDDHLVVSAIQMMPADTYDSVWVQLANDTSAFGWIHEKDMLPKVMPDDPISQFISAFSNSHVIIFLILVVAAAATYMLWKVFKRKTYIVHFHDIQSIYPTMLCLVVSTSATFYATIQMFAPQLWVHFYFHPTLNPFSLPLVLGLFILSVWAILIVALAAVDDVSHKLAFSDAVLYLAGLAAVCAVDYIVFSLTTLHYVGYPLLIAYYVFALYRHFRNRRRYICGNCGRSLSRKGRCPYCGAWNE